MYNDEQMLSRLKRYHPDTYERMNKYEYVGFGEYVIKTDYSYYLYFPLNNNLQPFNPKIIYTHQTMFSILFSRRLKNILEYKKMSQRELSIESGINNRMITRYLSGETIPSSFMLGKLSEALNCHVNDLMYDPSI